MNHAAAISIDELADLRAQIGKQQVLLAEQELEISAQQAAIELRDKRIDAHEETIAWLQERLNVLLAKRYQHSSEKGNALQLSLLDKQELDAAIADAQKRLDEAEAAMNAADEQSDADQADADTDSSNNDTASNTKPKRKPKPKPRRNPLPDHLRRVNVDVDVSDEKKQAMGDQWEQIGWETSEQLSVQEREYFVKVIRRAKYVRKTPDDNGLNSQGIQVAPPLPVIMPRAMVDASLLAKILIGKFVDAMSFNRECKVLEREGIQIGYSTVCSYPIQLLVRLEPLLELFYEYASQQPLWHLDETTLQVLDEPERDARQKSYIYALRAGAPGAEVSDVSLR